MALFNDYVPASALKIQSVWVDREVNNVGRTMEDGDIKENTSFECTLKIWKNWQS